MFDKTEKYIFLIMAIVILASVGIRVNNRMSDDNVVIVREETPKEYILAEIDGEVKNPGEYRIEEGSRLCDLVYAAGGITHNADVEGLKLDAVITDKLSVTVPGKGHEVSPVAIPVVNINTADKTLLCCIPGIGEARAEKIIKYRKEHGRFNTISDIVRVDGIGEATFEKIKDYIKTEETQK